ncbi:hypothetical protein C8R46DRAFT_1037896 [Mycena filopes]|nr:hypothetical protein C8R46DRAFT_1037886 [Mycena filopes]KAJ7161694.1 hypothetical protein C8R46DRAFT_1037896 [Mycena filopes]
MLARPPAYSNLDSNTLPRASRARPLPAAVFLQIHSLKLCFPILLPFDVRTRLYGFLRAPYVRTSDVPRLREDFQVDQFILASKHSPQTMAPRVETELNECILICIGGRKRAEEHKVKYPDYKFTPQRGAARTTRRRDPDPARCSHIASLLAQGLTESALRDEMEIFDKTRPPRAAVFEFASPILAESYQTFAAGSATALPLNCADEPNVSPIGAPNGIESSEGALYHGGPTVSLNSAPLEFVPASTSCFVAAAPGYALSSPDLNTGSLLHRPQGWLSEITSPSHIDAVTDMDAFGATAPLFMSNLFKFIALSAPPTSTELEDFFGMLCNL